MNNKTKKGEVGNAIFRNIMFGFVPVAIFTVCIAYFVGPSYFTVVKLEEATTVAKRQDLADGFCFEDRIDWWGNSLCISRLPNKERTAIVYTAFSAGKDGKYGTDDDLSRSKVDLNKSKRIGKWTGDKAVQFSKGLKEGLAIGSKHDK